MARILGTISSGFVESTGSYESIASGTGDGTGITFSNIPQTYQHLQLRLQLLSQNTGTFDWYGIRFNGDGGTNSYYGHGIYGRSQNSGQTPVADAPNPPGNTNAIIPGFNSTTSTNSNYIASSIIDILDYRNTNKIKVVRHLGGLAKNSSSDDQQAVVFSTALWNSTSAITSIQIFGYLSAMRTGSYYSLYGIKAV